MFGRVLRPVDLFDLIARSNQRTDEGRVAAFPTCGRCRVRLYDSGGLPIERSRLVDAVEMVEWGGTFARIRGRCHGREHVLQVKFPKAMDLDDEGDQSLWRAMWRGLRFFDTELER